MFELVSGMLFNRFFVVLVFGCLMILLIRGVEVEFMVGVRFGLVFV